MKRPEGGIHRRPDRAHVIRVHPVRRVDCVAADDILGADHDLYAVRPAVFHYVAIHLPIPQETCESTRRHDNVAEDMGCGSDTRAWRIFGILFGTKAICCSHDIRRDHHFISIRLKAGDTDNDRSETRH